MWLFMTEKHADNRALTFTYGENALRNRRFDSGGMHLC
jgi:hypothetical protein